MTPAEQIKSKIDIVDFISGYIQLKPAGSHWKARCPFHNEKSPSFMVSRDRQTWHCFGCSEGGDLFSFYQKIEGLEFPEALRLLAQRAGVQLERGAYAGEDGSKKARLLEAHRLAAELWHRVLTQMPQARPALDYVTGRGIAKTTIDDYRLGYAPDSWDVLTSFLKKKGFTEQEIIDAGLGIRGQRGVYDRFRGRVMFPIANAQGAIIAFTGRLLDEQSQQGGKYVNSPETPLYKKAHVLFGLDKAKQEIRKQDRVVLVEGNMDVLASHQAGVFPVVAASGTALTEQQLQLIKRFTNNIILCFDEDAAGEKAADKGIDLALAQGFSLRVVRLPKEIGGKAIKDPDDCIRADVSAWIAAIDGAAGIMEYYFDVFSRRFPADTAEGKKRFAAAMAARIAKLESPVERDAWLSRVAQKVGVQASVVREQFAKQPRAGASTAQPRVPAAAAPSRPGHDQALARRFLALILKFPQLQAAAIDQAAPELLADGDEQTLYKTLIMRYSVHTSFAYPEFERYLVSEHPALAELCTILSLQGDQEFETIDASAAQRELAAITRSLKRSHITKRLSLVGDQLRAAEQQKNTELITRLSHTFNELTDELRTLHG